jgi:hypothetical protein
LLGGHSAADFIINNESIRNGLFKNAALKTKDTLYTILTKGSPKEDSLKTELIKYTFWLYDPMDIPFDFAMKSLIHTCLDYEKP